MIEDVPNHEPLGGVTYDAPSGLFRFRLASRHATRVTVLLYRANETARAGEEFELAPVVQGESRVWRVDVEARIVSRHAFYGFRVHGPRSAGGRDGTHAFDRAKILLDPYAREVFFPAAYDRMAAATPGDNEGRAALGVIPAGIAELKKGKGTEESSHGSESRAPQGDQALIIYELHARGMTNSPTSGVDPARRGTFIGLIDKLRYLRELGITAVELMPVAQWCPQERNYWGYMPLSFFAVEQRFAAMDDARIHESPGKSRLAREQLRSLVKACHLAGIRVILDSVLNHTAEGALIESTGSTGTPERSRHPVFNLSAIDDATYYHSRISASGEPPRGIAATIPGVGYIDYSGAGNALDAANIETRSLVLESLRSWVEDFGIDGFRHDLAAVATRRRDGSIDPKPALFEEFAADPVLSRVMHIVEPWDAAGAYLPGPQFPAPCARQWNDKFRDTIRCFVRGDGGLITAVMRRLYGSDDLFPDPALSINYICSHDGFTLYDSLSYTSHRNEANGHGNRDGPSVDISTNCGFEGDGDAKTPLPSAVLELRVRRAKSFIALLLLANGTPMIRAGDEFLQTQGGNSNPYNQDNETSWLDWSRRERFKDYHAFVKSMIAFRHAHPSIWAGGFWKARVEWFGSRTREMDWGPLGRELAFLLRGREGETDLYVMANMRADDAEFAVHESALGSVRAGRPWRVVVDTGANDLVSTMAANEPLVHASSVVVLER